MRKNKGLRIFVTVLLVALLAAIAAAIVLLGTGRAAKLLEERGITFLSKKEQTEAEVIPGEAEIEDSAAAAGTEEPAAGGAADASAPAQTEAAPADGTGVPKEAGAEGTVETAAEAPAEVPVEDPAEDTLMIGDKAVHGGVVFTASDSTKAPEANEITSGNSLLINLTDDSILLQEKSDERISPASMTKVMTVLIAAEFLDPDAPVTMTEEMIIYCSSHDLSAAGFKAGKTYTVRDLMYGAILPSGGEAAAGLAIAAAGNMEDFITLMNQKLSDLGLSGTAHFTNCAGLYDEDHYCTLTDMAAIMKAALANDTVRTVLSTRVYTVKAEGEEDLVLSNWFLRRIEDKDCGGEVIAGKTGYVSQSGNCAVSYEVSSSGTPYICVTANSDSEWNCIYDHVALYKKYAV